MSRHRKQKNWGPRIREVSYLGMDLVSIENELLRVGVLAGKGTDVIEFNYKPRDLDFAWLTPGGVRNPVENYSTSPDPLATFTDSYPGGWQEVFPNGGHPSTAYGAQFGQHGEICTLPWDVRIDDESEESAAVSFDVRTIKTPFSINKQLRLDAGSATLKLHETIANESNQALEVMWGHHLAWGRPFLDESCVIRVPEGAKLVPHEVKSNDDGRRVKTDRELTWPVAEGVDGQSVDLSRVPPPGTACEMLCFTELREGWYEIESLNKGIGIRVEWDIAIMPYLWYWMEFGATTGYPWYGQMYTVGLEPFSSLPTDGLAETIKNGSTISFGPNQARDFNLTVTVFESRK